MKNGNGEQAQQRLREAALRDPLTNLWNRAGLEGQAKARLAPGAGVVLLDVEGKVLSWNEGAGELLGYEASEALGRDFIGLFDCDDGAVRRWGRLLQAGRRTRQESSQR